jgi:hypothetical protein
MDLPNNCYAVFQTRNSERGWKAIVCRPNGETLATTKWMTEEKCREEAVRIAYLHGTKKLGAWHLINEIITEGNKMIQINRQSPALKVSYEHLEVMLYKWIRHAEVIRDQRG